MNGNRALSTADRRRGLNVLLATTFLSWAGFFVVMPLISVQYVDRLGWTAGSVGFALAVRHFLQQGTTMFFGALADRVGAKVLICAGMLLRSLGFLSLAVATNYPRLILAIVLSALGGALFDSPQSAAIAALTGETERRRFYSLTGVLAGLGIVLGTQAGALLISRDFKWVSILAGACFLAIFVLTFIFLPPVMVSSGRQPFTKGLSRALHDRAFISYNALLMGYWFLWSQFYISVPLLAARLAGDSAIAWVYAVNSVVTILLGYTLPRALEKRLPSYTMLISGIAISAVGIGSIALTGSFGPFLVSIFVLSLGTVLVRPGERTVTAALADPVARGSYFGVGSLSVAIGGGLGNWAGGVLYDIGSSHGAPALPWLTFAALGGIAAAGLWLLGQRQIVRFERERPVPETA